MLFDVMKGVGIFEMYILFDFGFLDVFVLMMVVLVDFVMDCEGVCGLLMFFGFDV